MADEPQESASEGSTSDAARIAELEAQLAESRLAVETSEQTLQAAAAMLVEAEEMIDYSLKRAEMAEEFAEDSQRELEETTNKLWQAQEQIDNATQRTDKLIEESRSIETEATTLRSQTQQMRHKLAATYGELEDARDSLARFKRASEESKEKVDFVEMKLREAEKRARELGGEDVASSLPSGVFDKFMLSGALEVAVRQAKRHRRRVALLNFRLLRVTESEALGPQIIDRLTRVTRNSDLFAQLEPCCFAILIEEQSPDENARHIAKSLAARAASAFKKPLEIGGDRYFAEVAVGVSIYPTDGEAAMDIWRCAEGALSEAVESQTPGYHFHRDSPYRT